jgi:hypothetical protein
MNNQNERHTDVNYHATNSQNQLVGEHRAAVRLGLSVTTLRRWRWANQGVPWIKIGAAVRYDPVDLDNFIALGRITPEASNGGNHGK